MNELKTLNEKERIFLAGCMKSLVLSDGKIDEAELSDISRIIQSMNFEDFDTCLKAYEDSTPHVEAFWSKAEEIGNPNAQEIILTILDELSLQDGFPFDSETKLINELRDLWNTP